MRVPAHQRPSQAIIHLLQTQVSGLRLRFHRRGCSHDSCGRMCSRHPFATHGHGLVLCQGRYASRKGSSFEARCSLRFQVHLLVRRGAWQQMTAVLDQKMSIWAALIGALSLHGIQLQSFSGYRLGCLCRPSEEHATMCWKRPWPRRSQSRLVCQMASLGTRVHLIATYLPRSALFGQHLFRISRSSTHDYLSRNACLHSSLRPRASLQTRCEIACWKRL